MKNLLVLFLFFLLTACQPTPVIEPLAPADTTIPTVTPAPTATVIPSPPTSTATEIPSIPNPIDPENMDLLTKAGYLWDEQEGSLNNKDGNTVLSFEDGKWVDENEVESSLESLKINLTNGVDFDGNDIHAILTREVEGQREMYNFIINEWQVPMDIEGSMEAVSKNNIKKDLSNWKKRVEIEFEGVSEASWKDFLSGRLFLSNLLNLKPLDPGANIQPLTISMQALIQNHWTLSQFFAGNLDGYWRDDRTLPPDKDRPVVYENDAIRVVGAYKMKSPLDGKWLSVTSVRYQVNGRDLILHLFTGGLTTIPTEEGGAYNLLEDIWSYPARRVLLPVPSARKGDPCGLGALYASQPVCDLVGYDGTPIPRKLMPPELQAMMAEWDRSDGELLTSRSYDEYPVEGDWIFALQRAVIPANIHEHMGRYFLQEDDERLNVHWPDEE